MSDFTRGTYVAQQHAPELGGLGGRAARRAFTYQAFVPAPIADIELRLRADVAADVADAESALRELATASREMHGIESLARSLLRSEAVASSWIEALAVSHRKLAEAEAGAPGATYDEARRVVGNVRAMSRAIELGAQAQRLEVDDVLSMHGMLMSTSTLPVDRERAGRIRDVPVFIGGHTIETAEYVGPPQDEVPRLLDDLVEFINKREDLSGVVVAALAHAQFETIHPFHDGNGRVGRCLIHTVLRRAGVCDRVYPPLSLVLAQNTRAYIDGLNAFRRDQLDDWIRSLSVVCRGAADSALRFGSEVERLESQWRDRVNEQRAQAGGKRLRETAAANRLITELPGMPVFQINDVADRLGVTWMAAKGAVDELESVGVVKNVQAGRRNRVFEAMELFDLISEFEQRPLEFG